MKDNVPAPASAGGRVDVYSTSPLTRDATDADRATVRRATSVYVYEVPVRLWHWINAAAILTLCVTGYLIGSPLPSIEMGEATHQFLFGYIRFAHFAAAMVMTVGFFGRIYWAFAGNSHARQMFYIPFWRKDWWEEVWFEARWYMFLDSEPRKYLGHNPLAQVAMFMFMTVGMTFMTVTGFALYAEGLGQGSWADMLFGPLIAWVGNTMVLYQAHHLGMWFIVVFMMIHIYAAIREDIMSRQSMVSTMISGTRTFKDDRVD
ncbi:Ni/Fe-hydrogenase, b-type cytochrome subunit [Jannaschia seohaensis]|uniref:Probable Ni/Fe-hydrogenase B-type cytochrome subunit n=1 Tax=Jannaschia seohaensis TaxID=475081 RepID=A0A2Y9A6A1_9RHOB|nr:Ni/Fe-hydrogenase, b-type cytochrome subunit [Jannaschia seohaensis]PWJ21851.1 Ni/Fe-hydrogenase 1 B-type cytochrome subunit [Jannaschia seohaensis]SSA38129.1 Ni/Fe-hydrogenase 1 B-type cytochrome subunit [Jannaschia seohaensis]